MQTAERSTRSTHKHVTEQPEPDPALPEDSGTPGRAPAVRVIPTRSSRMADTAHPRLTYAKPPRPLHPMVRFRKDSRADPAFTPRECVTRRIRGAVPAVSHRRDGNDRSRFELRIAKLCDSAVHLIDPFGNSIEILTDVFHTYTLADEPNAPAELPAEEPLEGGNAAEPEVSADQTEPAAGGSTAPDEPRPCDAASSPLNAAAPEDRFPIHEAPSDDAVSQPPRVADDPMDSSPEALVAPPANEAADISSQPTAKVAPPPVTAPDPKEAPTSMKDEPAPAADVPHELSEAPPPAREQNPELTQSRQTCDSSGEEPGELHMQVDEPAPADLPAPESAADQEVGHSKTNEEINPASTDESKERPPTEKAAAQNRQDTPLPDLEPIPPLEEEHPAAEARGAPEDIGSSEQDALLQPLSKEQEKSDTPLAEQPIPQEDQLVTAHKREAELFERDIFQLEPRVEVPIVCDQEDDVGGNMKYISESEMIKLLEQDKDDVAPPEPPTDKPPGGDQHQDPPRPALEAEPGPPTEATTNWAAKGSGDRSNQDYHQDQPDLCSPPSWRTDEEPAGGTEEPPDEGATKATSEKVLPPGDRELCRTTEEPQELCRTTEEPQELCRTTEEPQELCRTTDEPQINLPDQPCEENAGLCAETSGEAPAADPDVQGELGTGSLSSPHDKMVDVKALTQPHEELQKSPNKAMDSLDVLDHEPSAEDDDFADPTSTAIKDKRPLAEDGADLPGKVQLHRAEAESAEKAAANRDLETIENAGLDLMEPNVLLPEEGDDVEKFIADTAGVYDEVSLSRDQSACLDNEQDSPEESEPIEEEPEEHASRLRTPEKPVGVGAECLKCGRRVRRGRKEQVWSPVCFKCRLVAKRKARLSNRSESPEFPEDPQVSGREGGSPVKSPHSRIQREKDRSQDISDLLPSLDPATGDKKYQCPKCDEAFKVPAQLAGHMKCHLLPQCLTCGCQIPLKYKTKRIPRRCQKCIQQMREGKGSSRQSGDELSGTSDNEDPSFSPSAISEDEGRRGRKSLGRALEDDEETDKEIDEKQEADSSSDELKVLANGEKPRICPQCGKAFKCNRSLNLHLLSHTVAHCESCGCRLQKKRRGGRGAKKCRSCKLQNKALPSGDNSEDPTANPADKASKRLKAKQVKVSQKKKLQSIIKQKKELKWKNMLLAVKKLMNKSKKRKEAAAAQNADPEKKKESSEGEKDEASSASEEKTSAAADSPGPLITDTQEAEPSRSHDAPLKTPKQGRKSLEKQKNVIKVEEDDILPCTPDVTMSPDFLKQEETWQCAECNQSLENLEALLGHQQSHIDGQSFTCPQCPQVFSSEEFLNLHIPTHDEKRPFRCPECGKTFTKRNHLGVHLRVHSGTRPFACPDCPRRFRQKATLLSHRYSHRNLEISLAKPHQCSVCLKSFKQKERLVIHERVHTGECPFSCKDCDKKFPSRSKLYFHRKLHKLEKASSAAERSVVCKEEEGPFHCQHCEKICSTKASFVLHSKVHKLSSGQDPETLSFHCKDCDKDFASKGSLSMHLKNHSAHRVDSGSNADPKQSFPCKDCDKVCSTKASFVLHRKMHQSSSASDQNPDVKVEDETPGFACKDCDKVCSTKASFAMHSKVHKSPMAKEKTSDATAAKAFRCKKCSVVFHTKVSFILHKKTHKPPSILRRLKPGAGSVSFRCKRCDIVFPTKANLLLHRKEQHKSAGGEENPKADGEPKSFPCKECDKICATKSSLVLHSKAHKLLGENPGGDVAGPFPCRDCDKVCSTKASLVLHRKVHGSSSSERDPSVKGGQEETFECKECGRMFSSKGRLSFHRFKKHGVPPKGDQAPAEEATAHKLKRAKEDKIYPCTICELKFPKLRLLLQHKTVHADRTATPCTYCGKGFLYKKSLINHMTICQSKAKGRKLLLLKKAAAAKRKLAKEGGGPATEESVQKKRKTEEKKKALTQKVKAKTQLEKKKPNKDKAKAKPEAKAKEKHPKGDGEAAEGEAKKTAPEKPNDARPDKPADSAPQEPNVKEKANAGKIKRAKKEAPRQKKVINAKKWRVMAAATVKKKKLQAVVVSGKKKLLLKKKKVPVKLKAGAKSGQTAKEN